MMVVQWIPSNSDMSSANSTVLPHICSLTGWRAVPHLNISLELGLISLIGERNRKTTLLHCLQAVIIVSSTPHLDCKSNATIKIIGNHEEWPYGVLHKRIGYRAITFPFAVCQILHQNCQNIIKLVSIPI